MLEAEHIAPQRQAQVRGSQEQRFDAPKLPGKVLGYIGAEVRASMHLPNTPPLLQSPASDSGRAGKVADALRYGREYDWPGHHVATILACAYLFLLPLATAPKDWAFAFLTAWTLIRLPHTWRSYRAFIRMPLLWATLAWVGWQAMSFLWSADLEQAWDEFKVHRMLITPLLLWPILDRAPWLVMAALLGTLAQSSVQGMQELGWIAANESGEGRLRGLLHPIHSASWFASAMLWHVSGFLRTKSWLRWTSAALALVSLVGVLATGSRGPWIALAIALPIMLIVTAVRRHETRVWVIAFVCIGIGALGLLGLFTPHSVRERVHDARAEITAALERQEYWSSTGLRLGLWGWALEVWRESPIIGVGAGDFAAEYVRLDSFRAVSAIARERSLIELVPGYAEATAAGEDVSSMRGYRRAERLAANRLDYLERDHAHSTYLHTLAQQGIIGLVLLLGVLCVIAVQCRRDRPDHPYSEAMMFVLVCWMIGAQFDCYELNGHQLGLIAMVASLTLPGRPPVRWRLSALGD